MTMLSKFIQIIILLVPFPGMLRHSFAYRFVLDCFSAEGRNASVKSIEKGGWLCIAKAWEALIYIEVDEAIQRNDIIRIVFDPLYIDNVFFIKKDILEEVFSSNQSLNNYLTGLSESSVEVSQLGYYGREIRHLYQNGYSFDLTLKLFIK